MLQVVSLSPQLAEHLATLQYPNEQRKPISVITSVLQNNQLVFHRHAADSPRLQLNDSLLNYWLELNLTVICICEEPQALSSQKATCQAGIPEDRPVHQLPWRNTLGFLFPFIIFFFPLKYKSTFDNESTKSRITFPVFLQLNAFHKSVTQHYKHCSD